MTEPRYRVMIERENEQGKKTGWRAAWLRIDSVAGVIALESMGALAKKWMMTFRPDQLEAFEIVMISDVVALSQTYGGGLLGWGLAAIMSRWAKLPVIELRQPLGEPGNRWVRIQGTGLQRRKATRDLAHQIATLLNERGYRGIQPNLADETLWKYPIIPVAIGCGIVLLVIVCLFAAVLIAGSLGSSY